MQEEEDRASRSGEPHLAHRVFTLEDQRSFAAVTGDSNPIHVDPVAARRTLAGQVVVHGLHTVTWALESYLALRVRAGDGLAWVPDRISATLPHPVHLDQRVDVLVASENARSVQLRAVQGGVPVLDLRVHGAPAEMPFVGSEHVDKVGRRPAPGRPGRSEPVQRSADELEGLRGRMTLDISPTALMRMFPTTCAAVGEPVVAQLVGLSTLVGMECPGMHSLLSKLSVQLDPASADTGRASTTVELGYEVRRFAPAYSLLDIVVRASGLSAEVMAFLRPRPVQQAELTTLAQHVLPSEFAGQRALVVGGSRGLGELTAKIIAAGGGNSIITYRHGEDDARRVAAEIRRAGGHCEVAPFDVRDAEASIAHIARLLGDTSSDDRIWPLTHLYYFATPRIAARKKRHFDDAVFGRFVDFYVGGFRDTVVACSAASRGRLRVLYPSTVFVDDGPPELAEYAAAKAAGEVLARHLDGAKTDVDVESVRLPRLPTDQTTGVRAVEVADPLPVMLDVVRRMARS